MILQLFITVTFTIIDQQYVFQVLQLMVLEYIAPKGLIL